MLGFLGLTAVPLAAAGRSEGHGMSGSDRLEGCCLLPVTQALYRLLCSILVGAWMRDTEAAEVQFVHCRVWHEQGPAQGFLMPKSR